MKILKIEVSDKKIKKQRGYGYCKGRITVGDFSEGFYILLDTWNLEQYKQQWHEGLERIKTHNSSCLIASISTIDNNVSMEIYYLYKLENKVLVKYQMYRPEVFKDLQKEPLPYDPNNQENPYKNIPVLKYKNEEGQEYEIWEADLGGIITGNL